MCDGCDAEVIRARIFSAADLRTAAAARRRAWVACAVLPAQSGATIASALPQPDVAGEIRASGDALSCPPNPPRTSCGVQSRPPSR